jgi:hypothetical protein
VAYLNCPECFYRVRTEMARNLDGEASCPRCARLGRLVAMYSTEIALRPGAEVTIADPGEMRLGPAAGEGTAA